jgi:septum site-determining protein MinC
MLSASDPSTSVSYEIKSADLALVALFMKTSNIDTLECDLKKQLTDTPDFFDQEPVVIDLSGLSEHEKNQAIDFDRLLALLRSHQMHPIALRSGTTDHMQAGKFAGLIDATYARILKTTVAAASPQATAAVHTSVKAQEIQTGSLGALVVDKPLRSGQQVYAKGRDLVLLAMVNPGAEVIADGNIHVYAALRGKAIAGAKGNSEAMIFAQAMEPELLSIAGVYRTSENALPTDIWGKAAHVRLKPSLEGEKLVIQALKA